ncbi:uncharacterized protein LY79DRAFT_342820 [Colletotrichum navitas]|uniref:Secreted protein n=1 Tax=Colletotrichum navitas TaxID=681940 RepID=A0AAD8V179_9PEZI|nr:uncharacterized protein LY79DRAFT_342820 [Colletotrichum navitas]KAK1579457.1 hypothetical protein LY79DRAFT_342820 [Colletotrichum navitas]
MYSYVCVCVCVCVCVRVLLECVRACERGDLLWDFKVRWISSHFAPVRLDFCTKTARRPAALPSVQEKLPIHSNLVRLPSITTAAAPSITVCRPPLSLLLAAPHPCRRQN